MFLARLVSKLPFGVLYTLSDLCFPLVYYVVRYRRGVVRRNLSTSFPEKTARDIKATEKAFYHWLCDYFVETLKLLTIGREELLRHIEFRNAAAIEDCFDKGQPCAALLGHYCNWEYLSATALSLSRWQGSAVMGLIYHPLRNDAFDRLFIDIRQHAGGTCIPKNDILRHLVRLKREGRMSLFGYILDQSPKWENIHLWLPFLHHDTPVFTGAERIVRKMNHAAFYVRMERPERGRYVCTFIPMTENPNELADNELTQKAFQMLEDDIRRAPQFYLWTHDRWKRTREEYRRRVEQGMTKPAPAHHSA